MKEIDSYIQQGKTNLYGETAFNNIADKINVVDIPYFCFRDLEVCGVTCRIGGLGYTGLDGVEILCAANDATRFWRLLSSHARRAGSFAANYLRLKAGLALFTHDFKPPVSAPMLV